MEQALEEELVAWFKTLPRGALVEWTNDSGNLVPGVHGGSNPRPAVLETAALPLSYIHLRVPDALRQVNWWCATESRHVCHASAPNEPTVGVSVMRVAAVEGFIGGVANRTLG